MKNLKLELMITKKQFKEARSIVIQYWQQSAKEHGVTLVMMETELYVDTIINKTGFPPTYRQVVKVFGLKSTSAAYSRLRRYRSKMKSIPPSK